MAAAAGILNHAMTAGQALTGKAATPMDSSTTGTGSASDSSGSDSATISANDFLTLLVTEMQNQDPTADTDPNEYINQLVQVNSLEQLIDINQTLTTGLDGTSPSTGSGTSGQVAGAPAAAPGASATSGKAAALPAAHSGVAAASQNSTAGHTTGNLSVPHANPAAQRVAHSLDGRVRTQSSAGSAFAIH
ncbi:MAG: flagellar hook capping FlgD N-terminal domain-containing protein [Terracidiphilus sp.]